MLRSEMFKSGKMRRANPDPVGAGLLLLRTTVCASGTLRMVNGRALMERMLPAQVIPLQPARKLAVALLMVYLPSPTPSSAESRSFPQLPPRFAKAFIFARYEAAFGGFAVLL